MQSNFFTSDQKEFWSKFFQKLNSFSEIPFQKKPTSSSANEQITINLSEHLKPITNQPTKLIAAWCLLISIYSNLDDGDNISFVTNAVSNRFLPFSIEFQSSQSITELEKSIETFKNKIAAHNTNLETIKRAAQNHSLVFNFALITLHDNAPNVAIEIPSQIPLVFTFSNATLSITFNSNTFDEKDVREIEKRVSILLERLAKNPTQKLSEISALSDEELAQQYKLTTTFEYPEERSTVELIKKTAESNPDSTAIIYQNQHISYREFIAHIDRFTQYLLSLSIQQGNRIAICFHPNPAMQVILLAIQQAGLVYVPISPDLFKNKIYERIKYIFNDADVKLLLIQDTISSSANFQTTLSLPAISLNPLDLLSNDFYQKTATKQTFPTVKLNTEVYVRYTSGTTGLPKGVSISHQNLTHLLCAMNEAVKPTTTDSILVLTRLTFDISDVENYLMLLTGAKTVIAEKETQLDPWKILADIVEYKITILQATPTSLKMITTAYDNIKDTKKKETAQKAFKHLTILSGGEGLPHNLAVILFTLCKKLFNFYGPTETTIWSLYDEVTEELLAHDLPFVPFSQPLGHTGTMTLSRQGHPVPQGAEGELAIIGHGVGGYVNHGLDAEKFGPSEKRVYPTGDIVQEIPHKKSHIFEIKGRSDDQIKLHGFRIELAEIEHCIMQYNKKQNCIQECAAIKTVVQNNEVLAAYIVPKVNATINVEKIKEFIKAHLDHYKIPSFFISISELPKTAHHKTDKKALSNKSIDYNRSESYQSPENEIQTQLRKIYAQELSISEEELGIDDELFSRGLDSFFATRITAMIKEKLEKPISVGDVLQHLTIRKISNILASRPSESQSTLQPIDWSEKENIRLISPAQERVWFLHMFAPDKAMFNLFFPFELEGSIDIEAFQSAFATLLKRHEPLRTVFQTEQGLVLQNPYDANTCDSLVQQAFDNDTTTIYDNNINPQTLMKPLIRHSFNLKKDIPIRIKIWHCKSKVLIAIIIHHIVMDGYSEEILFEELSKLYTTALNKENTDLLFPALPVTYGDYSLWQKKINETTDYSRQLEYWEQILENHPPVELITDRPRPEKLAPNGSALHFWLNVETSQKLNQLAKEYKTTSFILFTTIFQILMSRLSGQKQFIIGSASSGRTHSALHPLIGFFVNVLLLPSDLTDNPSFHTFIERVKAIATTVYANELPYEIITRELTRAATVQTVNTVFILEEANPKPLILDSKTAKPIYLKAPYSNVDLLFYLQELSDKGYKGRIEFNTGLFDLASMQNLLNCFNSLIAGILKNTQTHVNRLPLLSSEQHKQVIKHFQGNTQSVKNNLTPLDLFNCVVEENPSQLALECTNDQGMIQKTTYSELSRRANQIAHFLITKGIKPNDIVIIHIPNTLDMYCALFGIIRAGAAFMLTRDEETIDELTEAAQKTKAKILLTTSSLAEKFAPLQQEDTDIVLIDQNTTLQKTATDEVILQNPPKPEDIIYIVRTSGTTGDRKYIAIYQKGLALLAQTWQQRLQITTATRFVQFLSISADGSMAEVFPTLLSGGTLVTFEHIDKLLGYPFVKMLTGKEITHMIITPSALQTLPVNFCQKFKVLVSAAEAMNHKNLLAWLLQNPHIKIYNGYGPSENTVDTGLPRITLQDLQSKHPRSIIIDEPLPFQQLYVIDPETLELCPQNCEGMLAIGGDWLAKEYLGDEKGTQKSFIQHPKFGRIYLTGDKVILRNTPDGKFNIEYVGRYDQLVKIRGFRVHPKLIKDHLEQLAFIQQAEVIAWQAKEDTNKQLVAYIQLSNSHPQEDQSKLIEDIKKHCKQLKSYECLQFIEFISRFPLKPNSNKLDEYALPTPTHRITTTKFVAPENELQRFLRELWDTALDRDNIGNIGILSDFFEEGGTSLKIVLLVNSFIEKLKTLEIFEIDAGMFLEKTTIREQAAIFQSLLTAKQIEKFIHGQSNPEIPETIDPAIDSLLYAPTEQTPTVKPPTVDNEPPNVVPPPEKLAVLTANESKSNTNFMALFEELGTGGHVSRPGTPQQGSTPSTPSKDYPEKPGKDSDSDIDSVFTIFTH